MNREPSIYVVFSKLTVKVSFNESAWRFVKNKKLWNVEIAETIK